MFLLFKTYARPLAALRLQAQHLWALSVLAQAPCWTFLLNHREQNEPPKTKRSQHCRSAVHFRQTCLDARARVHQSHPSAAYDAKVRSTTSPPNLAIYCWSCSHWAACRTVRSENTQTAVVRTRSARAPPATMRKIASVVALGRTLPKWDRAIGRRTRVSRAMPRVCCGDCFAHRSTDCVIGQRKLESKGFLMEAPVWQRLRAKLE